MKDDLDRLFEPATIDGRPNPYHLSEAQYLARARGAAITIGRANGARLQPADVTFPGGDELAPSRVKVVVRGKVRGAARFGPRRSSRRGGGGRAAGRRRSARGGGRRLLRARSPTGRASRCARTSRARSTGMAAAARADGIAPDRHVRLPLRRRAGGAVRAPSGPQVGRPAGQVAAPVRHRARPRAAGGLRLARAQRARASTSSSATRWEPWHYGYGLNPRSAPAVADGRSAVPSFVPAAYRDSIARAASRWNVSAALLAAQIYAESGFNPFAVSPAGARGIAQFMPGTARTYGLRNPFDPHAVDLGAGAPDARPAARVRVGVARARRLQRRARAGVALRLRAALPGDARIRSAGAGADGSGRGACCRAGPRWTCG